MNSINILISLINDFIKNEKYLTDDLENNYRICQEICRNVIYSCDIPLIISGKDNIPKNDSILITPNHTSFFDIFLLISCIDRYIPFAAARELMNYPILNKYIESIDCVLIDRYTKDLNIIKNQLQNIENAINNNGLILFPEGECSYNDEINEFKKGGFMAASKLNTIIIPTYIDINRIKKIGKWCLPKDQVTITFGEPFKPKDVFKDRINSKKLSEYTRNKVLELKKHKNY